MKTYLAIMFLILLSFISCRFQKKSNNNEVAKAIYREDTIEEIKVKWDPSDTSNFSNLFSKNIVHKSVFKNFIWGSFFDKDYFLIILTVDGQRLINAILLNQNSFHEIIGKDKMFSINSFIDGKDTIYKLIYHNSYISFENSNHPLLILAKIKDKEVVLRYHIKIGMTKEEFFKTFFDQEKIGEFNTIDTFKVSDLLGEYKTSYVFKNNILDVVETETVDHWAIEKFKLNSNLGN